MFIDCGTWGIFVSSSGAKSVPGVTQPQEHFTPMELEIKTSANAL